MAILTGGTLGEATEGKPVYTHTYKDVLADNNGKISLPNVVIDTTNPNSECYVMRLTSNGELDGSAPIKGVVTVTDGSSTVEAEGILQDELVRIDFYQKKIENTAELALDYDKFAGSYYIEMSGLFRKQETGEDIPVEYVIPNGKVQTSWNLAMENSGDPSVFEFTVDCFPGYTKFDPTKKVLAVMQFIDESLSAAEGCEALNAELGE